VLDQRNYSHTRYSYDVPSGFITISYFVGPNVPGETPFETPSPSIFGTQIAQSNYSLLNGGDASF